MPSFVAFLRAINVGGHTVKMAQVKRLFEAARCKSVETFIASGNVVFESSSRDIGGLQRKIESHLHKSLGYEVKTFIRTASEVAAIARYSPFTESQLLSAKALNVAFLAEPLNASARKSLMCLRTEIDEFHVDGREVYWLCRKKQSESTFSNVVFEKTFGTRTTFRGLKNRREACSQALVLRWATNRGAGFFRAPTIGRGVTSLLPRPGSTTRANAPFAICLGLRV